MDKDTTWADYRTRAYYLSKGKLLWITRNGVDCRADSLLAFLKTVSEMGFSPRKFRAQTIEDDLTHLSTRRSMISTGCWRASNII